MLLNLFLAAIQLKPNMLDPGYEGHGHGPGCRYQRSQLCKWLQFSYVNSIINFSLIVSLFDLDCGTWNTLRKLRFIMNSCIMFLNFLSGFYVTTNNRFVTFCQYWLRRHSACHNISLMYPETSGKIRVHHLEQTSHD